MNLPRTLVIAALLTAAPAVAQGTQLVRGDVDAIQNTAGRFQLDCTHIPLVSTTVNLQQLHDASRQQNIDYEMQVRNVGTATAPILDVVSATAIPEFFGMGNLRFGRSETWEVFGTPGARTWIFVDVPANALFIPLGAAGTWLLSPAALPLAQGTISPLGRFQTSFTMPTIPALVGQIITSQAVILDGTTLTISHPDCKDVRAN
ncbi:MAG: hypothetical protein IPM29_05160 [Planctomycetes bacterium]|nr:hypothetical protein [Planctomycetota bacterium]